MKKTLVIASLLALAFTTGFTCSKNAPEQTATTTTTTETTTTETTADGTQAQMAGDATVTETVTADSTTATEGNGIPSPTAQEAAKNGPADKKTK